MSKSINDKAILMQPVSACVCASTITNTDEVKDHFYNDLDSHISAIPRSYKFILIDDFNVRVGTGHQTWKGVSG